MNQRGRTAMLAVALFAGMALMARGAAAQTPELSGADLFRAYCTSCHGDDAKGNGPLASALTRKPADLTGIARRNKGTFPADLVYRTIDGRNPVTGHGGGEMPIWGEALLKSVDASGPESVKAKIDALVRYLERLQAKP